ncbi:MAG: hypothetical protein ACO1OK_10340 [Devosia sp.]
MPRPRSPSIKARNDALKAMHREGLNRREMALLTGRSQAHVYAMVRGARIAGRALARPPAPRDEV